MVDGKHFNPLNSVRWLLLLVLVSSIRPADSLVDQDEEDGDDFEEQKQFIDDLLEIIKRQIGNVSSVEIPERGLNQQQNFFVIKNAQFLGLKELQRDGDPYVHGIEVSKSSLTDHSSDSEHHVRRESICHSRHLR